MSRSSHANGDPRPLKRRRAFFALELLEDRRLLSITVNASQAIGPVNTNMLGVNIATWDGNLSTSSTLSLTEAAGISAIRLPGGSTSDVYHFNVNNSQGSEGLGQMAEFAAELGATGVATINYGTGSPEEGAAMLAYLNAPINDPAIDNIVIGDGEQWNGTSWVQVNWGTVGQWATIRASSPISPNDGMNFLRIDHPAPFNFQYFEVGNEVYGSWETDEHGQAGDSLPMPAGDKPAAHDPTTYVSFAKQFATFAYQIDPNILIGVGSQDPGPGGFGTESNYWISDVLTQCVDQGFTPGFISDHIYPQNAGGQNDANLLAVTDTTSGSSNPYDLAQRAAAYRSLLTEFFGSAGNNILLEATEFNSVSSNPDKQSTSLVNGLYVADALGNFMDTGPTGYQGVWLWDLHNGPPSGVSNIAGEYGWRTFGDYGMLGAESGETGEAVNEPYPDYFAEQLASKIIQSGGTVVDASSTTSLVDAFAVLEANGTLDLMLVNKTVPAGTPPTNTNPGSVSVTIQINGFTPSGAAQIWQYGVVQDDAQANTGTTALADTNTNFMVSNGSVTYSVPDYSMTVIQFSPLSGPSVAQAAAANPNPVVGTTANLSVAGTENGSGAGLTYSWAATGPASVLFSDNNDATALNTTATFSQAGSYTFTATITDGGGLFTTSSIGVTVAQTPANILVMPAAPTLATNSQEQFSAGATDQFGNAIASPTFTWSISGADNSISSSGLASIGEASGDFTITAAIGSVDGTADASALAAPTLSSIVIGDGTAQRSVIDSLTVAFSEPVTLSPGAITLDQLPPSSGGASTPEDFNLTNPSGDQQTYVLTFTDASDIGGSLPDGVYNLSVNAADVQDAAGTTLAGGNPSVSFYRLFGDFYGGGAVNLTDLLALLNAYGLNSSQSGYFASGDSNGDGTINLTDLLALLNNYGLGDYPTASINPIGSATVGSPLTITATSAAASGADALSYQWSLTDGNGDAFALPNNGITSTPTLSFTPDNTGSWSVSLVATDTSLSLTSPTASATFDVSPLVLASQTPATITTPATTLESAVATPPKTTPSAVNPTAIFSDIPISMADTYLGADAWLSTAENLL
jgi:alpha-L-arabinofuranosidase